LIAIELELLRISVALALRVSKSVSKSRPTRLLISIGGGIAAYKVCTVISTLFQQGIEVRVILTTSAQNFITPLTVATLARHRAYTDADFWAANARPLHIELAEWADLILIAPLTANTLGKIAYGLADNLLTNTVLASTCPVLLAPAMNTDMWEQLAVQRNYRLVEADPRYHWCSVGEGLLACDRVGKGRMAEPETIITHLQSLIISGGKQDLWGKQILVSTGGTREFLDPVRFLGNPATGKMGLAIAQAAAHRGAQVTLVYGNVPREPSEPNIRSIATPTSDQMAAALFEHFPAADLTFMAAAVADVRPASYNHRKLAKQELPSAIPVLNVLDIAAELGRRKQGQQKLIGFAAQTGDIITPATAKLERKNLDAIVANPIDLPTAGFGTDHNEAVWIDRAGQQVVIPHCSKLEMAHKLLDLSQLLTANKFIES
jgi:phosphopantothenoylcysteine decarboxylase / phosphopantothenate---cysteine ligase